VKLYECKEGNIVIYRTWAFKFLSCDGMYAQLEYLANGEITYIDCNVEVEVL